MKFSRKISLLRISLILASTPFLTTCSTASYDPNPVIPAWPVGGPDVAAELRAHCFTKDPATGKTIILCPAVEAWLKRLSKFRAQLPDAK